MSGPGSAGRRFDWDGFVARRWARVPARLASPEWPGLRDRAFRLAVEISKPFRRGMRFFTLPNVRFFAGGEEIRAPGALLPGVRDRDLPGYLQRLAARLPNDLARVEIEQPLMADAAAWDEVRGFLAGLCDRVGCPLSPIVASLVLGRFDRHHAHANESVLLVPLQGEIRVRFEDAVVPARFGNAISLACRPGRMLYWPAGCRVRERCAEGGLALRLVIPHDPAAPLEEVRKLFATMRQAEIHPRDETPYLPFPPRKRANGAVAVPAVLARMHRALAQAEAVEQAEQALRVQWASRVSACALEPVPGFVACDALQPRDRVRMADGARIVMMPMGAGVAVWAVNGYAFAVQDTPASELLRRRLTEGGVHTVAELCGSGVSGSDEDAALALLHRLCGARALRRTGARESAGRSRTPPASVPGSARG
ncbi:hypothetical protein [Luteimonas aquatica]|uniref:hypothetical protein n=1 Tax=Luteimonas aquatica TaxID=450364 RepID=UPI001F58CABB|nr:hypothetical protein [Luteimonas aquatica]